MLLLLLLFLLLFKILNLVVYLGCLFHPFGLLILVKNFITIFLPSSSTALVSLEQSILISFFFLDLLLAFVLDLSFLFTDGVLRLLSLLFKCFSNVNKRVHIAFLSSFRSTHFHLFSFIISNIIYSFGKITATA